MFTAASCLPGHIGITGVLTHCKSSQLFHITYMLLLRIAFSCDWRSVKGIPCWLPAKPKALPQEGVLALAYRLFA